MGKSFDDEIREHQDKIREIEQKKYAAEHPTQEYPKWVTDPEDPTKGYTVTNKEQEAKVLKGESAGTVSKTFDLTPEEEEAKRNAKADADKEAAGAKSRLGPDASTRAGREAERKREAGKTRKVPITKDAPKKDSKKVRR